MTNFNLTKEIYSLLENRWLNSSDDSRRSNKDSANSLYISIYENYNVLVCDILSRLSRSTISVLKEHVPSMSLHNTINQCKSYSRTFLSESLIFWMIRSIPSSPMESCTKFLPQTQRLPSLGRCLLQIRAWLRHNFFTAL